MQQSVVGPGAVVPLSAAMRSGAVAPARDRGAGLKQRFAADHRVDVGQTAVKAIFSFSRHDC